MDKNKKALVSTKTIGFRNSLTQRNSKPSQFKNQHFCSFCKCKLSDNAVIFKGIATCSECLDQWKILDENLRAHLAKRKVLNAAF